jgi:hypothetical protein
VRSTYRFTDYAQRILEMCVELQPEQDPPLGATIAAR